MMLLNKRGGGGRMAVRGGGDHLYKQKILVAYILNNTGKLVVNTGKIEGI